MPEERKSCRELLRIDPAAVTADLTSRIKADVHKTFRRAGAVVGVSGGVDSSVVLALCARALGPSRVLAVMIPERESSPESVELGRLIAEDLGVEPIVIDVTAALEGFGCYRSRDEAIRNTVPEYEEGWTAKISVPGVLDTDVFGVFNLTVVPPDGEEVVQRLNRRDYLRIVAASNFKQRTRMAVLYHLAEARNFCVVGTTNKNEYDQGFFVKHGDHGYDIGPLRHLYKTQVYQLADHLGLPEPIRRAVPTADTYPAASSQEEFFFRMPFHLMDPIWYGLDHGFPAAEVAAELGLEVAQVERAYADLSRKGRTTKVVRAPPVHYG